MYDAHSSTGILQKFLYKSFPKIVWRSTMRLVYISSESASVEDCIKRFKEKFMEARRKTGWYIVSAELNLTFGAFMHLSAALLVDESEGGGDIAVEYATAGKRETAISAVLEKLNSVISNVEVVSFKIGTYTTPVTRRTYAVGVVAYNRVFPAASRVMETRDRRELLAHILALFDYNPKVLNISELARIFGVSRDTIYYDIQRILKDRKKA
jgi:hypothetical protein